MRSLERGARRESLDAAISRVAFAYGFSAPPVALSRRAVSDASNTSADPHTAAQVALINNTGNQPVRSPLQIWGSSKRTNGTTLSFTILAARHGIAHALVVKAALSVADLAGYTDLAVSVSSIGDAESRRRFTRELGNFFKKNHEALTPERAHLAIKDPEKLYRELLHAKDPLAERLPRPIDYLSENSRKTMTDTLKLFEAVHIQYSLEPHLTAVPGVHAELVFSISGLNKKGERLIVASGGRFDELMKKRAATTGNTVGMSVTIPNQVEPELSSAQLSCFIVHVGDAAKLKAFGMVEALWRANVAVGEALMAETLKEQMEKAKSDNAQYIAIVGQREALDNTVILRNANTQMQFPLALDKLAAAVSKKPR